MASDDLERAPSIGPKTAERFAAIGIKTVADLLAADPGETTARLDASHIAADVIAAWQAQARLVMAIAGLAGTHAQLLTGAGFATADEIASAEPASLCAAVLAYAATSEGQRILRDGPPPDVEKIRGWIDSAAAKAA
jgi:predicted flap endonuclease-1-like 5' DNA nuclease